MKMAGEEKSDLSESSSKQHTRQTAGVGHTGDLVQLTSYAPVSDREEQSSHSSFNEDGNDEDDESLGSTPRLQENEQLHLMIPDPPYSHGSSANRGGCNATAILVVSSVLIFIIVVFTVELLSEETRWRDEVYPHREGPLHNCPNMTSFLYTFDDHSNQEWDTNTNQSIVCFADIALKQVRFPRTLRILSSPLYPNVTIVLVMEKTMSEDRGPMHIPVELRVRALVDLDGDLNPEVSLVVLRSDRQTLSYHRKSDSLVTLLHPYFRVCPRVMRQIVSNARSALSVAREGSAKHTTFDDDSGEISTKQRRVNRMVVSEWHGWWLKDCQKWVKSPLSRGARHSDSYARFLEDENHDEFCVAFGAPCNLCERGLPYGSIQCIRNVSQFLEFASENGSNSLLLSERTYQVWKFGDSEVDEYYYYYNGRTSVSRSTQSDSERKSGNNDTLAEVKARGIRNSVGLDWHPWTKDLWFTDDGADHLGKDRPECELNSVPSQWNTSLTKRPVFHFGFPYCHTIINDNSNPTNLSFFADNSKYRDWSDQDCYDHGFRLPELGLGPHTNPMGMLFEKEGMFSGNLSYVSLFVALHGSRVSEIEMGYRVMNVRIDNETGQFSEMSTFLDGFVDKQSGKVLGRPVDVAVMPDGSVLVSDDYGAIYRVLKVGQ